MIYDRGICPNEGCGDRVEIQIPPDVRHGGRFFCPHCKQEIYVPEDMKSERDLLTGKRFSELVASDCETG